VPPHPGVVEILKGFKDISTVRIPHIFAGKSSGSHSFLQTVETLYKPLVNRLDSPAQKTETETVKTVYKGFYKEKVGALIRPTRSSYGGFSSASCAVGKETPPLNPSTLCVPCQLEPL
jgi:hypothetical protein